MFTKIMRPINYMKAPLLLASLLLASSTFADNSTGDVIAEFSGSVPSGEGWSVEGGIPLKVVTEGTTSIVDFNDDSETGFVQLKYKLDTMAAEALQDQGFTIRMRARHISNGDNGCNFAVLVRLRGIPPLCIRLSGPGQGKDGRIETFEPSTGKTLGTKIVLDDTDFANITAVYRPANKGDATFSVGTEGGETITVPVQATEVAGQSSIEIGNSTPDRTGQVLVESFKLTTP